MSKLLTIILILAILVVSYCFIRHLTRIYMLNKVYNYTATHFIKPTANNTLLAFDLNEVLVMADIKKIWSIIWQLPKINILLFFINPWHWPTIIKAAYTTHRAEFFFEALFREYPSLAPLEKTYITLFRAQQLNNGLIEILKELKQHGYTCYILSNIGPKALAAILKDFPIINDLFDGFFIPTVSNHTGKHHPEFFEQFKQHIASKGLISNQIVLIDNYAPNIIAAYKAQVFGILFTSNTDLMRQFKRLTIL